jgi:hypothetical protein
MDLDAHVVDHANDIFDLFGFYDAFREVVVNFRVGEISLLLTFCYKFF